MEKAKKRARPPPDDPAQSERFIKAASELISKEGGSALYERAMNIIAKPLRLPEAPDKAIISPARADTKMAAKVEKKKGSSRC